MNIQTNFSREWLEAPRSMANRVESRVAEYWFLRGFQAGRTEMLVIQNHDLHEIARMVAERGGQVRNEQEIA